MRESAAWLHRIDAPIVLLSPTADGAPRPRKMRRSMAWLMNAWKAGALLSCATGAVPPRAAGEGELKVLLLLRGSMLPEYDAKKGACK